MNDGQTQITGVGGGYGARSRGDGDDTPAELVSHPAVGGRLDKFVTPSISHLSCG